MDLSLTVQRRLQGNFKCRRFWRTSSLDASIFRRNIPELQIYPKGGDFGLCCLNKVLNYFSWTTGTF
jgi:hypothetical protein